MTPPRPSTPSGKQLAAVATAAIPVVMLSSLAMAGGASAAPAKAEVLPQGAHGTLDGKAVLAAVKARTAGSSIPAAVVAGSVPRAVTAAKPAAFKAQSQSATKHTVVAGDTVSGIAATHGVSVASILTRNNISASSIIRPGQVLVVSGPAAPAPAAASATADSSHVVRAGETLSGIAAQNNVSLSTVFALNGMDGGTVIHPGQKIKVGGTAKAAAAPAAKPAASTGGGYVIKAGDTLSAIAAAHNVSLAALASANGTSANGTIYAGKTLTIPGVSAAAADIAPISQAAPAPESAPVELSAEQQVPSTFLHYTYPDAVVNDANRNKAALLGAPSPTRGDMKEMVARTAASMGVDPALALAFAQQESGFNHQSVSPANAIGTMQVIPSAGEWASGLVGRKLNLLDPQDNVTAGVAIIRALHQGAPSEEAAIAGYYQGQYSVSVNGMFPDTVNYVAGIKANRELFR